MGLANRDRPDTKRSVDRHEGYSTLERVPINNWLPLQAGKRRTWTQNAHR